MKISVKNNPDHSFINKGLVVFLCATPWFFVTLEDWSSGILIVGFLLCSIVHFLPHAAYPILHRQAEKQRLGVMVAFVVPSLLITLAGLARQDLDGSMIDSSMRFVVAIPIFMFVLRHRMRVSHWLYGACIVSLWLTFLNIVFFPQPERWGAGRLATAFSDPLVLGYSSLLFAAAALASLFWMPSTSRWWTGFKISAAMLGAYLSIRTGSRTGWLALPLLLLMFTVVHRQHRLERGVKIAAALGGVVVMLVAVGVWKYVPSVSTRIQEMVAGILSYPLHGMAPDTSTGLRITFLRMAWVLLSQSPWDALVGLGETFARTSPMPEVVRAFASPFAIHMAFSSGFHNEIVTVAVGSGVLAGLSMGGLFIYPASVFFHYLRSPDWETRACAHLGMIVVVCFGISSLSTEVFGLKHTVSFYALILALLLGACIGRNHHPNR